MTGRGDGWRARIKAFLNGIFSKTNLKWTALKSQRAFYGHKQLVHYQIYFVYNISSYHRQIIIQVFLV